MRREKCLRVMIAGHYGGENLGDEAMLLGLIEQWSLLRPGDHFEVVTKEGKIPPYLANKNTDAEIVSSSMVGFWKSWKRVLGVDVVVVGGGTHFHDDYSSKRYLRHFAYLVRLTAILIVGRLAGKKVGMLGMGFGPFRRLSAKVLWRISLWASDVVTVRDCFSEKLLAQAAYPFERGAFDLASLMKCVKKQEIKKVSGLLGISVMNLSNILGKDQNEWLSNLAGSVIEQSNKGRFSQIKVFIIRGGNREDDRKFSNQFVKKLQKGTNIDVQLTEYMEDPTEFFEMISNCEFFVAMRYHSAVLSSLGKSRLATLCYHLKMEEISDQLGLPKERIVSQNALGNSQSKEAIRMAIDHLANAEEPPSEVSGLIETTKNVNGSAIQSLSS